MNEPHFVLSRRKVLEQFEVVKGLSDIVSYSSKTNPIITSVLEENTLSMFSVHSVHELKNVNEKSKIIFLAQGWNSEEILFLLKEGINNFVVDNVQDLETLKSSLSAENKINLFLRLKLKENTLRTEKHFVFGFNSDFINKNLISLKEFSGINSVGIHFHRKTQNMSEWDLSREIKNVLDEVVLSEIDSLIMGGGLPSIYANTNVKVFDSIYSKIKEFKDWLNSNGIKLIIEPGRFISAPAVKLVTHIKAIYENNLVVDASVYNSDMDALVVPVKLLVEGELEKGEGDSYVVKGITPCSMDLFRYKVYLKNPKVGDEIVFLNAGAYNFTTDFCSLPKIETIFED